MAEHYDVAVVGGGVVGLSHAWMAAARGNRVVLFERSELASGASVRNFGMVWPIGQPAGEFLALALKSRELWLQVGQQAGIWVNPCGSLHVAHRSDELEVLEEFVDSAPGTGVDVELLNAEETLRRSPGVNPDGLLGAMWSSSELCINPRTAIATLPKWLQQAHGVDLRYGTTVTDVDGSEVRTADGSRFVADKVLICSGIDFHTLFPQSFLDAGLQICKLQMMQTGPQANQWRIGPHLASGLTLRHYSSFEKCSALAALKKRVADETPELDRYGIHVMASQNELGQVTLGDSHQYGDEVTPFDESTIDSLMIRELKRQFVLPNWHIERRWNGIYSKHPTKSMVQIQPQENVCICVGPGGAGMTLSLGYADRYWTHATEKELAT